MPSGVYYGLALLLVALASKRDRILGLWWAGVYWVAEAACLLAMPLVSGVARWESDIIDPATFRSVGYVETTATALVVFHTAVAISSGTIIAIVMSRGVRAAWLLVAGALIPLGLEAAAEWRWALEWCGTIVLHLATRPEPPQWLIPFRVAVIVGVSHLMPPLLAGLCGTTVTLWRTRWRGASNRRTPSNGARPTGEA